ncbi:thioredoxin-like protein [Pelagophyceae sp. CCMP2097]|nr:thioredoxin-like protein [Pelagophyceae sp. CCMP2097]
MDRGDQAARKSAQLNDWDDVLIKKGIVTREQCLIAKGFSEDQVLQIMVGEQVEAQMAELNALVEEQRLDTHPLEFATADELDELEEDDFDDDAMLQKYREQRLAELKLKQATARFGSVDEIEKVDWTRQVNEVSEGAWVVVHLYQDHVDECVVLDATLRTLAVRFPAVKFVRIKATSATENWPDHRLPALFLYHEGIAQHQLIGPEALGLNHSSPARLAMTLVQKEVLDAGEVVEADLADFDGAPTKEKERSLPASIRPRREGFFNKDDDATWDS